MPFEGRKIENYKKSLVLIFRGSFAIKRKKNTKLQKVAGFNFASDEKAVDGWAPIKAAGSGKVFSSSSSFSSLARQGAPHT